MLLGVVIEMMQTLRDKDVGIISRNLLSYHCKSKYNFNFYIERINSKYGKVSSI